MLRLSPEKVHLFPLEQFLSMPVIAIYFQIP